MEVPDWSLQNPHENRRLCRKKQGEVLDTISNCLLIELLPANFDHNHGLLLGQSNPSEQNPGGCCNVLEDGAIQVMI